MTAEIRVLCGAEPGIILGSNSTHLMLCAGLCEIGSGLQELIMSFVALVLSYFTLLVSSSMLESTVLFIQT